VFERDEVMFFAVQNLILKFLLLDNLGQKRMFILWLLPKHCSSEAKSLQCLPRYHRRDKSPTHVFREHPYTLCHPREGFRGAGLGPDVVPGFLRLGAAGLPPRFSLTSGSALIHRLRRLTLRRSAQRLPDARAGWPPEHRGSPRPSSEAASTGTDTEGGRRASF
jgi:hypothetical protein